MESIDLFVKNWATKSSMVPFAEQDIVDLEAKLGLSLPSSFKYLLSTYGLVHTPNVLSKTCDLSVDISEVQDFLSLEDVYSLSQLYEMTGMPKGHILFASDSKGNMFCFKAEDCVTEKQDIPVWYFDHGQCLIEHVSTSFTAWLDSFNEL